MYRKNKVQNYSVLQGVLNPSDLNIRPPRNINARYITIENSSNRKVGISIQPFLSRVQYLPPTVPVSELSPPLSYAIATKACAQLSTIEKIDDCIEPLIQLQIILQPGEIGYYGVNTNDAPDQFIYILDPISGKQIGLPQIIERTVNQFVLREGINAWWVQKFHRTT